jgi:putrescine aminotransferase
MAISDPDEFGILIARETEKIIREIGPERIASFSAEPVQGAGGLIVPPATYWPEIARICKANDILLHADEVITGFGRTGEWFGSTTYGLTRHHDHGQRAELRLPADRGGVAGQPHGRRHRQAKEELVHGFTYSGHPVASAVALKNLKCFRGSASSRA